MLKAATSATRAPRGTKPVSQAFFTALESIPEASRAAVEKAAVAMIRDEIKMRREKTKAAAAKEKARTPKPPAPVKAAPAKAAPVKAKAPKAAKPTPAKRAPKAEPAPAEVEMETSPKRRGRKPVAETAES